MQQVYGIVVIIKQKNRMDIYGNMKMKREEYNMGLNINGKVIIYKNTYGYSTSISRKNQDGEYEKMYLSVQLPKGVELENKTKINITKGFLGFYNTKEGLPKIKVVVMEYILDEESKNIQQEREAIQNEEFYGAISESDLPF
jgi:hypothetical protein